MTTTVEGLQLALCLAFGWVVWFYGWKPFALDVFRQRLFTARDRLFDVAAEGKLGLHFNMPVYGALRAGLNNRLRFAHAITPYHLWYSVLMAACTRHEQDTSPSPAQELIKQVHNPELRKRLERIEREAQFALLRYVVMTSPTFFACALVVGGISVLKAIFSRSEEGRSLGAAFMAAVRAKQVAVREVDLQAATAVPC